MNKKVKVCPVCNSQDISLYNIDKWELMAGFWRKKCNNCGYVGPITIMEKKDADKLKVLKPRSSKKS